MKKNLSVILFLLYVHSFIYFFFKSDFRHNFYHYYIRITRSNILKCFFVDFLTVIGIFFLAAEIL